MKCFHIQRPIWQHLPSGPGKPSAGCRSGYPIYQHPHSLMLDDLMGFALGTNSAPATVSAEAMAIYKNFRFPVHCATMNKDALGSGCGAPSRGQREVSLVPHVDVTGIVPADACRSHPHMSVPGKADGPGLAAASVPTRMFRFCMMLISSLPWLVDTSYGCCT